jgi:hypothetical protein
MIVLFIVIRLWWAIEWCHGGDTTGRGKNARGKLSRKHSQITNKVCDGMDHVVSQERTRYVVGVILLLMVVLLWTGSNFVTQVKLG